MQKYPFKDRISKMDFNNAAAVVYDDSEIIWLNQIPYLMKALKVISDNADTPEKVTAVIELSKHIQQISKENESIITESPNKNKEVNNYGACEKKT